MERQETRNYVLPTWTFPAIVNGDYSGISDDEAEQINNFVENEGIISLSPEGEEYFSLHTDFNTLGTTCQDCTALVKNQNIQE